MTRQWVEHARKAGQISGPAASDNTFAAGVNHVTELLPSIMTDITNTAPEDQKVRFLDNHCRTFRWRARVTLSRKTAIALGCSRDTCIFRRICAGCRLTSVLRIRRKSGSLSISGSVEVPSQPPCFPASRRSLLIPLQTVRSISLRSDFSDGKTCKQILIKSHCSSSHLHNP